MNNVKTNLGRYRYSFQPHCLQPNLIINLCDQFIFKKSGERVGLGCNVQTLSPHNYFRKIAIQRQQWWFKLQWQCTIAESRKHTHVWFTIQLIQTLVHRTSSFIRSSLQGNAIERIRYLPYSNFYIIEATIPACLIWKVGGRNAGRGRGYAPAPTSNGANPMIEAYCP